MGPEPLGDRARVTAGKDAGRSKYVGELAHGTGNDVMDEGIYSSLTDIARAEGIDRAYVSRVFKLTRASPIIVEQALAGKVKMEALMAMGGCWVRQEA